MRRSSTSASPLASPVLVGAVTILVVIVAVFLAYNANNGLPFVPTTSLKVLVPNGANLVPGNEVRTGGFRVGVIEDLAPVKLRDGRVGARLDLKLDKEVGDIPRDSRVKIRPRSALGLKYLELTAGHSKRTFRDGDTLPVDQADVPVEIDEVFGTFDRPTREASQVNLDAFGAGLASRGASLGELIETLPGLTRRLEPVMRTLSDPETGLTTFFSELADAARIIAPVSATQARLFTSMADTFEALSRDTDALKATIAKAPRTLEVGTDSLRAQRPFLADLAAFSGDLRGAARELRASLPTVNRALARGVGVQRRAVELNEGLGDTLGTLRSVSEAPGTNAGLRGLTATATTLNPQIRFYGPYITVCNAWTYFWVFNAEHFSEADATGQAERALLNTADRQDNGVGSMGAVGPANGKNVEPGGHAQFLKAPPFGEAVDAQGRADCEWGQRGYIRRQAKFLPKDLDLHRDPRTPGLQGTTYTGRPRVPGGQTFTSRPETGPYKDLPVSESGDP